MTQEEWTFMNNYLTAYPREQQMRKMMWRRMKIENSSAQGLNGKAKFSEENPISIDDAFISSGSSVFDMTLQYVIEHPIETVEGFNVFCEPEDQISIGIDIAE